MALLIRLSSSLDLNDNLSGNLLKKLEIECKKTIDHDLPLFRKALLPNSPASFAPELLLWNLLLVHCNQIDVKLMLTQKVGVDLCVDLTSKLSNTMF